MNSGSNKRPAGHVAVLTGDLIGFTRNVDSEISLSKLEEGLMCLSRSYNFSFQVFRGDSFQGILLDPSRSLEAALLLRSFLISRPSLSSSAVQEGDRSADGEKGAATSDKVRHDARIAIGIGEVDRYDLDEVGRGDGAAFRMSGRRLDEMKRGRQNLTIVTPWGELNNELDVECALMEVIISKWTREQALSVFYTLQGMNQYQISERLGRSQGGISQRLSKAGYWAIVKMTERFNEKINQSIGH